MNAEDIWKSDHLLRDFRRRGYLPILISRKNSGLCRSRFHYRRIVSSSEEWKSWANMRMGCKCWKQQLYAKWYSSSFGLPCAGLTALAVVWIRLTVGRGWMLPENKSLHCSCLLMHCLLGAWFMLVARSRTISTKWILCQAACLTEIFTLFSNCFPPDWICSSIVMDWLLLSRWLVYLFFFC